LKNLKYKKNQYTEGFSICALLIAGMFFYWGFNALFENGFWRFGVDWISLLWIGIGSAILISQIAALANRSKLKNVVLHEFEQNPNISVEEISNNTGVSVRDIRAIILDLKGTGKLKGQFSTKTGDAEEMKVSKVKEVALVQQKIEPDVQIDQAIFCPFCGTPIKRSEAAFCAFCGSKLK
jgi:hypothetical protein